MYSETSSSRWAVPPALAKAPSFPSPAFQTNGQGNSARPHSTPLVTLVCFCAGRWPLSVGRRKYAFIYCLAVSCFFLEKWGQDVGGMGVGQLVTDRQPWVGPRPPSRRPPVGGLKKNSWQHSVCWKGERNLQVEGALLMGLTLSLPPKAAAQGASPTAPLEWQLSGLTIHTLRQFPPSSCHLQQVPYLRLI